MNPNPTKPNKNILNKTPKLAVNKTDFSKYVFSIRHFEQNEKGINISLSEKILRTIDIKKENKEITENNPFRNYIYLCKFSELLLYIRYDL